MDKNNGGSGEGGASAAKDRGQDAHGTADRGQDARGTKDGRGTKDARGTKRGGWFWLEVACVALVVAASLHSASSRIGGGDTWVAMACGRYSVGPWAMADPGRTWQMRVLDKFGVHLTQVDPLSPNSRPYVPGDEELVGWVNQNWLTHVLFYRMKTGLGGDEYGPQPGEFLIVVYKFVQAVLTGLFAYWAARVLGANALFAAGMAAFGVLLSRSFIDLRPNVSSILFAAMMFTVLAYWKRGQVRALLWMGPLMVVWANVHGGFIYAIMIFGIMAGGHLTGKVLGMTWPRWFFEPTRRQLAWLIGAAVGVLLIPGIFSPFGWENLKHPFVVAVGEEGKVWRDVIEWRPIYDARGFGNAGPYIVFLVLGGVIVAAWAVALLALRPRGGELEAKGRRRRLAQEQAWWPRLDLPLLAALGVTVAMSIESRRFIYLGGVVLVPLLAWLAQEFVDMVRVRWAQRPGMPAVRQVPPAPSWLAWAGTGLAGLGALAATIVFVVTMWTTYFSATGNPQGRSLFRQMVGIEQQPEDVVDFLRKWDVEGVVFNEWNQGGFVAFHQEPEPATGKPPCQVYMDGRAQAAYTLEHYQRWQLISQIPGWYVRGMVEEDEQRKQAWLRQYAAGLAELGVAVPEGERDSPEPFAELLRREGVNVALVDRTKSRGYYETLAMADGWRVFARGQEQQMAGYMAEYVLLMDTRDPRTQASLERIIEARQAEAGQ